VVVIPTNFNDLNVWADCVHGFIRILKQTDTMHIVSVVAIGGLAHWGRENAASDKIDRVWRVNNHMYSDTYWTVYHITLPEKWCAEGRQLIELY